MDLLLSYAPLLARGALTTLALALISLALATFLGAAATLARLAGGSGREPPRSSGQRTGHASVLAQHTDRRLPASHSASWNQV